MQSLGEDKRHGSVCAYRIGTVFQSLRDGINSKNKVRLCREKRNQAGEFLRFTYQISHDHIATAFHFLTSNLGGGAFFFLGCVNVKIAGERYRGTESYLRNGHLHFLK